VTEKLRAALRFSWVYFLWIAGALWLAKRRVRARGAVVVLTLHRIVDDAEFAASSSLPGILIRDRTFDQFLAWASRTCEIADLGRGTPDWDAHPARPRIALTFDDGWLDNYRFAQPLAARHGASMTVFVCPGLLGRRFPFWPERVAWLIGEARNQGVVGHIVNGVASANESIEDAVERLKRLEPGERCSLIDRLESAVGEPLARSAAEPTNQTMSWDEIRELHQKGVCFGSHTQNHTLLTRIAANCAQVELTRSRAEIEEMLGEPCELFAYPNGDHNASVRRAVAQSGYRLAFTTEHGEWVSKTDRLLIPRINVSESHLIGPSGRFSPVMSEYSVFWRRRHGGSRQKL
jgi:peptidoglycan/xylan/chitin deacetylase (PgdA/CDA1 family)